MTKLIIDYKITEKLMRHLFMNNQNNKKERTVIGHCADIREAYSKEVIMKLVKLCEFDENRYYTSPETLRLDLNKIDFLRNLGSNELFDVVDGKIEFNKVLTFEEIMSLVVNNIDNIEL